LLNDNMTYACQLAVQPSSEFSVTLALSGYQLQTVSVRPEAQAQAQAQRRNSHPIRFTSPCRR
jgi:hypothetical protein